MVIFTPKSLLRAPVAASLAEDLTEASFQPVIDDALASADPRRVERVMLSFGKVYYDLLKERELLEGDGSERVSLVRIEELYPWPSQRLREILSAYENAKRVFWVQEEPRNMGAWSFVRDLLPELLPRGVEVEYAGREPSASTAVGSMRVHRSEQMNLVADAFEGLDSENSPGSSRALF
jgi:2-oxoglutarate dehydrogenase E1 component